MSSPLHSLRQREAGATHQDGINQVDTFRATWQTYANGPATGGLGKFDTSLNPACH